MHPEFITFTGVDDETDPSGLVQLADDYPVEFGLLFSPKRQGIDPRYPKLSTIAWLSQELPLRWAAHLCGGDARAWLYEDRCEHDLRGFQRVQINTADPNIQPSLIGNQAAKRNLRAILQCRGEFPHVASVDVLFDASGGRGIVSSDWPEAVNTTFCGYAGGLRPENVAQAVAAIGMRADRYWIDMESGVRDERDRFSLEKCRAVCKALYGAPRHAASRAVGETALSAPTWEETAFKKMRNRLFAPGVGQRCIFDAEGGWPYEKVVAKKKLSLEATYTITRVEVHSAHTRVWLEGQGDGHNDWFNSMLFRPALQSHDFTMENPCQCGGYGGPESHARWCKHGGPST